MRKIRGNVVGTPISVEKIAERIGGGTGEGTKINDNATTTTETWSSKKISDELAKIDVTCDCEDEVLVISGFTDSKLTSDDYQSVYNAFFAEKETILRLHDSDRMLWFAYRLSHFDFDTRDFVFYSAYDNVLETLRLSDDGTIRITTEQTGGGGAAVAPLFVTVSGSMADHSSTEIINHINKGGAVYLKKDNSSSYGTVMFYNTSMVYFIFAKDPTLTDAGYEVYGITSISAVIKLSSKYVDNALLDQIAVLCTEQALTPEQQAQARENIGAAAVGEGGGGGNLYTFRNLLNPNDENYEAGKYVNPVTGKTANNAGYNTSGYIEVNPGDRIVLSVWQTNAFNETYRTVSPPTWYAYYDENKAVVKGDGRTSGEKIYHLIPSNVRYIRISITASEQYVMIEKLACVGICDEYLDYGTEKVVPAPAVDNADGMFLPPYIYAVKGRPFDIYTAAMFGDPQNLNRIEQVGYTASGFGTTQMSNRRLRISPANAANINFYFKVKNAEGVTVLSSATRCLARNGSTATKNILTIGDSLTDSKPWIAELMRLNPNYTFVGSIAGSAKDSEGTTHTFKHDGRSGWRAEQYYTGYGGTANSFWDGSKFSFSHYVTNTLGGTAPDVVILFLGMNDMEMNIDNAVNYEKLMVDNIRSSYPNMPIIICAPQARDYNAEGHVAKDGFLMMKKLYETFCLYTNLYFVPLYLIHDSEYNYCLADEYEGVNLYSPIVKNKVVDSVHPQNAGYFQFADAIYGALSAIG